jgi:hypothetical protein
VYQVSGDTYTSIAIDQPPASSMAVAWSNDSQYLAVGHLNGRRLSIYKRGSGDSFELVADNVPPLVDTVNGCAFDPSDTYLAACLNSGERLNWFAKT